MNFLFLHGGYHGAWCWEPLIVELKSRGHEALAIDFPGAGKDTSPRRSVTKETYLDTVDTFISKNNLSNLVLVGHSLAGVVMPEVFVRNSQEIDDLIFIAAIVLEKGERGIDFIPEDRRPKYFELAEKSGDGTVMWDFERAWKTWFSDFSEFEARKYFEKLTPQPLSIFLAESSANISEITVPKSYILCKQDQAFPEAVARKFANKLAGKTIEINCGHEVMLSNPKELSEVLTQEAI